MTDPKKGEEKKEPVNPAPAPERTETDPNPKVPVEGDEGEGKDIDFAKELEALEGDQPTPVQPAKPKTQLEKARTKARHVLKEIEDLGGDPAELLGGETPEEDDTTPPKQDTSGFVTKLDLARTDARKLARSEAEYKLIMWRVEHQGLTVEDAHLLANKGRIQRANSEIQRGQETVPAAPSGPGERTSDKKVIRLNEKAEKRLQSTGHAFDPATNSYTATKTRTRFVGNEWISERSVKGQWVKIENASNFD